MKSVETQKVELLEEVIKSIKITKMVLEGTNTPLPEYAEAILKRYEAIVPPQQFDDPMIEDVLDVRTCNIIRRELNLTGSDNVYLKDAPDLKLISRKRGFGRKSESFYREVLKEYNLHHKL